MRTFDQPIPYIVGHRPGPEVPMGRWPAQLHVGIERVPEGVPSWDDAITDWDGGEPWEVWDHSTLPVPPTPFAPEDVVGAVACWVADDLVLTDGNAVASWVDRIGGFNVSQGTPAAQPTYRATAVDGKPAVEFSGASQYLSYVATAAVSVATEGHVFVLADAPHYDVAQALWATGGGSGNRWLAGGPILTDGQLCITQAPNGTPTQKFVNGTTTPLTDGSRYLLEWSSDGSSYAMRVNDVVQAKTVAAGTDNGDWFGDTPNRNYFSIGARTIPAVNWPTVARIVLVLVVDGPISLVDRDSLNAWVAERAGAAPPAGPLMLVDAICNLHGMEFGSGSPSPEGTFDAGELNMTLDNRSGQWSQYDAAGRLTDFFPGRIIAIWADIEGEPWWLWFGKVSAWRETYEQTVEVAAFDDFSDLNQNIGKWTPGTAGQNVAERIEAILALIDYEGPTRLENGDVTLLSVETDKTPLEEIQTSSLSDGGIVGIDADGTLFYRSRAWTGGREDQEDVPVLSTNVPAVDAVVWEPMLTTDDLPLVNLSVLANLAEPPITVTATNLASINTYGQHTEPEQRIDDLWETEAQGETLAEYIVDRQGEASLRIESAALYLHDPRYDLWRIGIDRRLGDIVELLHDQPSTGGIRRIDLFLAVVQIHHSITPSSWVVTIGTTRSLDNRPVYRWDESIHTWDEDHPHNLWSN